MRNSIAQLLPRLVSLIHRCLSFAPGFNQVNNPYMISPTVSTVSLVTPFQAIPLEKEFILLGKGSLAVVLFLPGDVPGDSIHVGVEMQEGFVA